MAPNAAFYSPQQCTYAPAKLSSRSVATTSQRPSMKHSAPARSDSLAAECEALKRKIRRLHPQKTSRFSLSHMRRVAIPPVEIPPTFTNAPTFVAGKKVLFTKQSFVEHKYERRLLRRIREDEMLRM